MFEYLNRWLPVFDNEDGSDGISSTSGTTGDQPGGESTGDVTIASRPEWAPEKYWDSNAGELRVEELAKGYSEIVSLHRSGREAIEKEVRESLAKEIPEGVPESADKYELVSPDIGDGLQWEFKDDDPMLKFWRETAHAAKMTQEDFNKGVELYVSQQVGEYETNSDIKSALGEKADARIERVNTWLGKHLDEKLHNALGYEISHSAAAIEGMEKIMEVAIGLGVSAGDDTVDEHVDEDQLRKMMADPRYRGDARQRDPAFIKKVTGLFEKMHPGMMRASSNN
jgi:hypothetical protein